MSLTIKQPMSPRSCGRRCRAWSGRGRSPPLAPFGPISDHFRPRRHRLPAPEYRQLLHTRFTTWREVAGLQAVA